MTVKLSIKPLVDSNNALTKTLATFEKYKENEELESVIKAALVQNFEVTFELSWKYLYKWLVANRSIERSVSKKQILRYGAEYGLLENLKNWFEFLELRNLSSHTYDEELISSSFDKIVQFNLECQKFLNVLEGANE
jgi:nucleotidyltransferase substrate binding protein (TIGR01987 family)